MHALKKTMGAVLLAGSMGLPAMTAAQQTGSVTATAQPLTQKEKEFVKEMAQDSAAEIQQGRMAINKAISPEVKAFGARMVADHAVASQQLTQLAAAQNVKLSTELSKEAKEAAQEMKGKTGTGFDKTYMTTEVIDHEKSLDKLSVEAARTNNAQLKQWMQQQIPILREHLQQARQLNDQLRAQLGASS